MSVISKDFNHSKDFHMLKQGNCFRTSIIYADIQDELFKSEEVVKEAKNKIDSLSNIDIRKEIINTNKENVKKKGIKKGKKSEDGKEIINNIEENIIKGNNNNNNNIRENSKERQINNNDNQDNILETNMNNNKEGLQKNVIQNTNNLEEKIMENANNKEKEQKMSKEKLKDMEKDNNNEIFNDNNPKGNENNNNEISFNCEIKPEVKEKGTKMNKKEDSSPSKISENEILLKKLELYERNLKLIKEKYSKEKISKKLTKKKDKLEILNLKREIYGKTEEFEQEENILKKEIEECEFLLKNITVTLKSIDKEFDGIFISTKEFTLKNSLNDEITITADSLVIVEVKNYNNYIDISFNLEEKKKLLYSIGFPPQKLFFVGILRSLDEEKRAKGKIKGLKSSNMIIIYPDELTFLGVPLFEEKKEKIEKIEKKEDKEEKQQSFEDKMDKRFQDVIQMINKLSDEMKDFKIQMNNDINYLKKKIDK